jgi:hypothetical protein
MLYKGIAGQHQCVLSLQAWTIEFRGRERAQKRRFINPRDNVCTVHKLVWKGVKIRRPTQEPHTQVAGQTISGGESELVGSNSLYMKRLAIRTYSSTNNTGNPKF